MVDVRGYVLRPPHGTTPAAVKANKIQKKKIGKFGIRILRQNNKVNVDFTEIKGTFSMSVAFERPF